MGYSYRLKMIFHMPWNWYWAKVLSILYKTSVQIQNMHLSIFKIHKSLSIIDDKIIPAEWLHFLISSITFFIFSWNVLQEISEISFVLPAKIIILLYSLYEKVIFFSFPRNRSEDNPPKACTQVFLISCQHLQIESEIIKALLSHVFLPRIVIKTIKSSFFETTIL